MQGLLDLPVPQAADDGVEQRREHCVDHGHQLVEVEGVDGARLGVDEKGGRVEDDHHSQVRGTGGEGLVPAGGGRGTLMIVV